MSTLVKILLETLLFFLFFVLLTFLFDKEINWKLIIIGTIVNLDFNIILNWISNKDKSNKK
jgi:hypothetical protein